MARLVIAARSLLSLPSVIGMGCILHALPFAFFDAPPMAFLFGFTLGVFGVACLVMGYRDECEESALRARLEGKR